MSTVRVNDGCESYICEYGHLHDYSKIDFDNIEKDVDKRNFNNVDELKKLWRKKQTIYKISVTNRIKQNYCLI